MNEKSKGERYELVEYTRGVGCDFCHGAGMINEYDYSKAGWKDALLRVPIRERTCPFCEKYYHAFTPELTNRTDDATLTYREAWFMASMLPVKLRNNSTFSELNFYELLDYARARIEEWL